MGTRAQSILVRQPARSIGHKRLLYGGHHSGERLLSSGAKLRVPRELRHRERWRRDSAEETR